MGFPPLPLVHRDWLIRRKIKLLPGQFSAETVATLIHDIAREKHHRTESRASTTKRVRETEAEAVAFIVCQAIGRLKPHFGFASEYSRNAKFNSTVLSST